MKNEKALPDVFEALDGEAGETPEFAETPDDGEIEELEAEESAEKDEKHVPLPRLKQEIRKRHAEREAREAAEARSADFEKRLKDAETRASGAESLGQVLAAHYDRFKDPVAQARIDAEFLDTMEQLAAKDPAVQAAVRAVESALNGRTRKVSDAKSEKTPGESPAVQKILEREARRQVDDVLKARGVKESFRRILADELAKGEGAADLDEKTILRAARDFVKRTGITSEELFVPKKAESKERTRPATGSGRGAAESPARQGESKAPEGPKSRDEWMARKEERLGDFLQGAA